MLGSAVCEADAHRCLCEVSIRREQDGTGCGLSDENIHIRSHSACDLPGTDPEGRQGSCVLRSPPGSQLLFHALRRQKSRRPQSHSFSASSMSLKGLVDLHVLHHPILPFISRWIRLFISTAYSSGSSFGDIIGEAADDQGSPRPPRRYRGTSDRRRRHR